MQINKSKVAGSSREKNRDGRQYSILLIPETGKTDL